MSEEEKNKPQFSLTMENIGFKDDESTNSDLDLSLTDEIRSILAHEDEKTLIHFLENKSRDTLTKWLLEASNTGTVKSVFSIIEKLKVVTSKEVDLTCITGNGGNTALHVAAKSSSTNATQIIDLLLMVDPKLLEKENKKRRTPLHSAAYGLKFLFCRTMNLMLV